METFIVQDNVNGHWAFVSEHSNGIAATIAASQHKNYLSERVPGNHDVRVIKMTFSTEVIIEMRS